MLIHPPDRIQARDDLVLRRETADDAELIARTVRESLDHLAPWMAWATPEAAELETQRRNRERSTAMAAEGTEYFYLLTPQDESRMLGASGLHRRIGPGGIEIGYWLHPDAVGHGYITAAVRALTEVALALPDVDRVEIHCNEMNVRSAAVPERLGYRLDRVEDPTEKKAPAETGRDMIWVYDRP